MADFPLLNEASLVMIPGATKEGKVYSQVPTDGSGDFTFTRSTTATRVNEAGNIEKGYENLLYPSNDFSGWTNINSVLTPNQAGYDGSNDAWLLEATSAQGRRYKNISDTGVLTYSIYAKSGTADILRLRIDAATDMDLRVDLSDGSFVSGTFIDYNIKDAGNGWWRVSVTQNITSPVYIFVYSDDVGSIYIQDAQLNQGLVAYPYLETTTAPVYGGLQADQPRLDYTDATCPSLLLEPSRTNLLGYSEYFEGWHSDSNVSHTANSAISPEGLINAAKLTATNTSNAYVRDNRTSSAGNNVFSVFAKYEDCQYIILSARFFSGGDEARVWFDIQNGVKGGSAEDDVTYDIEDYGNGWYRCYVIFNIDAGDPNGYSYIYLSNIDGFSNVTSGTSAHLYGGQWELGSYPTSYIPTYGSAQTRANDYFKVINQEGLFGANEGTFFMEFAFNENNKYIGIGDTFPSSSVAIGLNANSTNRIRSIISNNGVTINLYGGDVTLGETIKACVSYGSSGFKLFMNGNLEASNATPSNLSQFSDLIPNVNVQDTGSSNSSGDINQILVFPTALTDTECIALTTL